METVQDLMITSIARSTRTICSSIFTQFMLEYPLEETRVEQHINHLLKNLAYFDSEGRLQVLDILHNLIERFPRELTDQYAELIFFTLTLRVVNETHTKVRERVLAVLKRLFLKASPAKSKALFNTVIQMNQQGGNELKRRQLCQARLVVMKAWVDSQGAQIKSTDAVKVIEVCMETVQKEALIIVETKGKRQKRDESSDSQDDEEVHNPEMKQFLKNIELMEEDQAQVKAPVQHQFTIDFEEEKHSSEWSPLYFALLNIENLISQQVASNFKLMQNLIPNILLLGLHHHTYWIRLGVQRIFGALFSTENISLQKALGVENSNGVIDIMFKLTSCFKFRPQLDEEMGNQLVKNITFLLRSTLKDQQLDITRLFNRCSIFGRKLMLNVQTAKPLIANILLFFQVAFHLFTQINDSTSDNTPARAVLAPVLDLVYRIYTDEQYSDSRAKELSFELVDYLSTAIDKSFFINAYNEAKASVHKKRLERKRQQKVMMASAQGAQVKERKRARKVEKKKEKKRQKIMEFELRKN